MDHDGNLPFKGPIIDLNKVAALNHRRSVTLMNNFLVNTSNFLNHFSVVTEENIAKQTREMEKLEIAVNILETKLDSIPGLNDAISQSSVSSTVDAQDVDENSAVQETEQSSVVHVPENVLLVKNDRRYAKFLKMKTVGVPLSAIEAKMLAEGLHPNLLETPDAPVPDLSAGSDSESQSSGDGFSD